jgi:hypothetical protein
LVESGICADPHIAFAIFENRLLVIACEPTIVIEYFASGFEFANGEFIKVLGVRDAPNPIP